MPAGNNTLYETTLGCSTGLSLSCYVNTGYVDGWYYDGNVGYAYYIASNYVTSIDTAPCVTAAPPPPPPVTYDYYDYERCTGTRAYTGILITIQIAAGGTPPSSVTYGSFCYALYSSAMSTPTNTPVSYSGTNCACN